MFCFLCNSKSKSEIRNSLFDKRFCDESGSEKQSYLTILFAALSSLNIDENNIYSKVICNTCTELLNLYESIENKYIRLKCKIIVEYNKTAKQYGIDLIEPDKYLMNRVKLINNDDNDDESTKPTEYLQNIYGGEKSSQLIKKISEELNFEEIIEYEKPTSNEEEEEEVDDYFSIPIYENGAIKMEIFEEESQQQLDLDNDNSCSNPSTNINDSGNEITASQTIKTETKFYCENCGRSFTNSEHFQNHKKTHLIKPFNCHICGKQFGHRSNLSTHIRSIHLKDNNYKCNICDDSFSRKRQLECHIRTTHTGERPFKCNICGSTFAYPHIYARHLKIHAGIRYSCEICGKNFNSRDNRNSHRFIHSNKKRYECSCGSGFMKKSMLQAHMKKMGHDTNTIVSNSVIIE